MELIADRAAIVGSALKIGRELRGLSLQELARRSGVSRQHLHAMEAGETGQSSSLTLQAIADALELPVEFLRRAPVKPPDRSVLHMRSKRSAIPQKVVAQELARASVWSSISDGLKARCTAFPADGYALDTLPEKTEEAAELTRRSWGLRDDTPIEHVMRLLERNGALIGLFSNEQVPIDAYSWFGSGPLMLCNMARHTPSRLRFSLMHEAAHLVLHRHAAAGAPELERQADAFASAALLPRRAFWQEFPRRGEGLDWQGMLQMKRRWGVSIQTLVMRAYSLGIISANEYRRAFIRISQNGWRTTEPAELDSFEKPELPINIVRALHEQRGLHVDQIAAALGLSLQLLEQSLGHELHAFVAHAPQVRFLFGAGPTSNDQG